MLPAELWCSIFELLDFRQKCACESVCKAWKHVLRNTSGTVWGTVVLQPAPALSQKLQELGPSYSSWAVQHYVQAYMPITRQALEALTLLFTSCDRFPARCCPAQLSVWCRWLKAHCQGMAALELQWSCCRHPQPCLGDHRQLPIMLASLKSVAVNVHLSFACGYSRCKRVLGL